MDKKNIFLKNHKYKINILNLIRNHCILTLKTDKNIFLKKFSHALSNEEKEKLFILKTYYDFIDNKTCLKFIKKTFLILNSYFKKKKKEELIALSIIILKSFLDKQVIGNLRENYINSDEILNNIVDDYKKYLFTQNCSFKIQKIESDCLIILSLLANNGLLKEKKFLVKGFNFKTIKYYKILNIRYNKSIIQYINFSFIQFNLTLFNDIWFITNGHFSKTLEFCKKNFYSDEHFKIKNELYFLNKINIPLFVDKEYQINLLKILDFNEDETLKVIKNNINKLNNLYKNNNWSIETKFKIAELQKQNAKALNSWIYWYFANYDFDNASIYFLFFLDFRGRKYYYSNIGPTSAKILRLAYFYGWYNQSDFTENNNYFSINYYQLINNFCIKYKIKNNKNYYEVYFWCLIGIGKFFINKSEYPISVEKFLMLGVENFNNFNNLNLEDFLEAQHYTWIIKDMTNKLIKKRPIIKDATASINQILVKELGPKNQNSLNYLNLGDSWEWYDTYTVIADLFYKEICKEKKFAEFHSKTLFNNIFSRKLIKNTIMIIPYGAGNKLCWKNFKNKIIDENLNIQINSSLQKIFLYFCNFIRQDLQIKYLFNKEYKEKIEIKSLFFIKNRVYIATSCDGDAGLGYYKLKDGTIDKTYYIDGEKKRVTKVRKKVTTAVDLNAFKISIGANSAHFEDANEIRILESELGYSIVTIHDSYLIDFKNCSTLIKIKIKHYQKVINNQDQNKYEIKNIFILL